MGGGDGGGGGEGAPGGGNCGTRVSQMVMGAKGRNMTSFSSTPLPNASSSSTYISTRSWIRSGGPEMMVFDSTMVLFLG